MAATNNPAPAALNGEIATIRDILMGQQMAEYKAEFASTGQQMQADKAELAAKLKALGEGTETRIAKLEREMTDRFDRFEKRMEDHIARLDLKLIEMSKSDKQDLGQMLAEISKKLTS